MKRFNKLLFCLFLLVPLIILISGFYKWWRANYEWVWENTIEKKLQQKITMDFRNTPIEEVLAIIASQADIEIVKSPAVTGNVTVKVIDVPLKETLGNILAAHGYRYVVDKNMIKVAPMNEIQEYATTKQTTKREQIVTPAIKSLDGLKNIHLVVMPWWSCPEKKPENYNSSFFEKEVEATLMKAGIKIPKEKMEKVPLLYISINYNEASDENTCPVLEIDMNLSQLVHLERDPLIVCYSTTWENHSRYYVQDQIAYEQFIEGQDEETKIRLRRFYKEQCVDKTNIIKVVRESTNCFLEDCRLANTESRADEY